MTDTANLIARLRMIATSYHPACNEAADAIECLSQQVAGYIEQHGRDSAELRRLCAERDEARAKVAGLEAKCNLLAKARDDDPKGIKWYASRFHFDQERIAALESELDARESAELVSAIWEYSFIHSSATGRGETKVGPCLTYSREQAFGVGCIEQRLIRPPAAAASEAMAWRCLLDAVLREIDDGEYAHPYRGTENAPGHAHDKPGIWDWDNGAKAGTQCAWCMTWNAARAAIAATKEKEHG